MGGTSIFGWLTGYPLFGVQDIPYLVLPDVGYE